LLLILDQQITKQISVPFIGLDENGRYSGSVAENLEPGADVITVTATDRDEFPDFKKVCLFNSKQKKNKIERQIDVGHIPSLPSQHYLFDKDQKRVSLAQFLHGSLSLRDAAHRSPCFFDKWRNCVH